MQHRPFFSRVDPLYLRAHVRHKGCGYVKTQLLRIRTVDRKTSTSELSRGNAWIQAFRQFRGDITLSAFQ